MLLVCTSLLTHRFHSTYKMWCPFFCFWVYCLFSSCIVFNCLFIIIYRLSFFHTCVKDTQNADILTYFFGAITFCPHFPFQIHSISKVQHNKFTQYFCSLTFCIGSNRAQVSVFEREMGPSRPGFRDLPHGTHSGQRRRSCVGVGWISGQGCLCVEDEHHWAVQYNESDCRV
jgi:hypothetical protein